MVNRVIQPPPRRLTEREPVSPVSTDGELLMRYRQHDDQLAFAELVDRHGAMVWGVCSRVLVRRADAEDAYQATWLILARKSRLIRENDSAGGWLYRVAYNTALAALRRRKTLRETSLEEVTHEPEAAFPDLQQRQLVNAMLEELRSLPKQYQTPLVLRYLEGRSRRQIAAAMDATVATVAGQLVRGRRLLRSRLARRGVSLGLVLGALGGSSTSHAMTMRTPPPSLNPAFLTTGSSGAVSVLVNQGIRSMFYASLTKPALAGLATVAAVAILLAPTPERAAHAAGGQGAIRLSADLPAASAAEEGPVAMLAQAAATGSVVGVDAQAAGGGFDTDAGGSEEPTDELADLKRRFARMAQAEANRDLSQPGFEELYWQAEHWRAKESAIQTAIDWKQRTHRSVDELVGSGEAPITALEQVVTQIETLRTELPLAKAKIAEYERLMKQAALRELGGVASASPASSGGTGLSRPVAPMGGGIAVPAATRNVRSIQPGQLLKIEVINTRSMKGFFPQPGEYGTTGIGTFGEFRVDREGQVALGATLGRVEVAGLSLEKAETEIHMHVEEKLLKVFDPDAVDIAVQVTRPEYD